MGVMTPALTPTDFQQVLSRTADLLSRARSVEELAWAISDNLSVWVSLSAAAGHAGMLPHEVSAAVSAGAKHIIDTTLASGRVAPPDQTIEEFIRLNRQMVSTLEDIRRTRSSPPS